jgi:DNA-binding transcriptional MerR regulator
MDKFVRRGQLAKILGIPTPTVKYYTSLGLFPVGRKTAHGQYLYDVQTIQGRYTQIREMKQKRFTIQEIQDRIKMDFVLTDS